MIKTLKPNRTRRWLASRIFCGIVYTYTHDPKESRWSILCRIRHIEGTDRRKETGRNEAVYVCRWCSRLLVADRLMRRIIRERANLLNRWKVAKVCIVLRAGKIRAGKLRTRRKSSRRQGNDGENRSGKCAGDWARVDGELFCSLDRGWKMESHGELD